MWISTSEPYSSFSRTCAFDLEMQSIDEAEEHHGKASSSAHNKAVLAKRCCKDCVK